VTADYLDSLTAALSFDRSLARRVRREFEDHLEEALAADCCADRAEAERRAIADLGDPRAIAAELAVTALARRSKQLAGGLVLALLGVLLTMKGRVAWYAAMQWGISAEMQPAAATMGGITRYAFWTAIFIGAAGWVYGSRHRLPSDYLHGKYSRHLRRFCLLAGGATAALAVAIFGDAALTAMRLGPLSPSPAFFLPVGSIVFEIACAGALIALIRAVVRRAGSTARLQQI
jgi:hypothetical protein